MLWIFSIGLAFYSLNRLLPSFWRLFGFQSTSDIRTERLILGHLHELDELLQSGHSPSDEFWNKLSSLPEPWGSEIGQRLLDLRRSGSPLVPTLKRLRAMIQFQSELKLIAKSKSSQSWAQVWICLGLVPLLSTGLVVFLPTLQSHFLLWAAISGLAMLSCLAAAFWIRQLTLRSIWGRMGLNRRVWLAQSQLSLESMISRIRSGISPDLAWSKTLQELSVNSSELALCWGPNLWSNPIIQISHPAELETTILTQGRSVRQAIQTSLMEGRPCTERIEGLLDSLRVEIRNLILRELELLPAQTLKPLFILVAPALLLMVFSVVGIVAMDGLLA